MTDLCTVDNNNKKKSTLVLPKILPRSKSSNTSGSKLIRPILKPVVKTTTTATTQEPIKIPVKETNMDPPVQKAVKFLPEPVEYYSWKAEGTYTDYDGKLWYLPNNVGFSDWVNREFVKVFDQKFYREPENPHRPPLFNYQQFIKNFFTVNSPYRGILLNHHMGSGKSRTAIVTAEQFRLAGYKMIFMLPASLRDNAIGEIRLWGDSDLCYPANYGSLSETEQIRITNELNIKIRKAYNFVSYNSSRVLKDLAKINLENCCIIIDEVHDLVNTMANEAGKTGKMIYEYFMRARNCRFIAMSGTPPPINYPFELGLLFNFLRGPIPKLSKASVDKVLGSRGDNRSDALTTLARQEEDMYGLSRLTAYPEDKIPFDDLYVDYKTKKLKNEGLFRSRGIGLTSFFHGANRDLYPTVIKLPLFKCEMDRVQFEGYMKARRDEIIRESKRSGRQLGPNTFRPNSRQFCNFGMPSEIDRPISLSKFKQITFNNPRLNSYESLWTEDQKNELDDLFYSLYEVRNDTDYSGLDNGPILESPADPTLSTQNIPNTQNVFEVLRNQCEKQVERIRLTFRARWAAFKDQHSRLQYLIKLIKEAGRLGSYSHIVSRNEEIAILEPSQNHNGVEVALTQLSGPYKNYLLEDLGKSSQKHKKMHENIESGPGHEGPIFVYSSFRTMEGIEIFSRELDVRGYRKFDPMRDFIRASTLDTKDVRETSDADADGEVEPRPKLYAILSGAESTELRTQILNFFNHPRNIRGAYLKILLGTSASAQGLSLLNCRQVHIMEPWWTLVLILQVIGRVCRIRSHHALPVDERNVYVYEYLSTISKEQSTLINNEELSTDEYLYLKAIEKDELNQQFYVLLKEIAIDVVISGKENRPLENGLKSTLGAGSPMYLGGSSNIDAPYSLWRRDNTSAKKPSYNYMPNIFDECIEFTETTLSILGTTSNASGNHYSNDNLFLSPKSTGNLFLSPKSSPGINDNSQGQQVKTIKIDRKYVAVSVSGEKYIYFIDDKNKPEVTKKMFKGEKIPIKVVELYDFRSMKYSQSCVLRAYVDEAGKKREVDMVLS
jgi:hypothetical protein